MIEPQQRALSCATKAVLIKQAVALADRRVVNLGDDPIPLRGRHQLGLSVLLSYDVERAAGGSRRQWSARLGGHAFELEDALGRTVVAYHWHPAGKSPVATPHLHLGGTIGDIDLSRAHLPTGIVSLPEFLAFAIRDLGVQPLRPDWPEILRVGAWGG